MSEKTSSSETAVLHRRDFLKLAGAATLSTAADPAFAFAGGKVCVVVNPQGITGSSVAVKWAIEKLNAALTQKGIEVIQTGSSSGVSGVDHIVLVTTDSANKNPALPESFSLIPSRQNNIAQTQVVATDERGFIYGLLELAERIEYSPNSLISLQLAQPIHEVPANTVRSIARAFCSELEDKPWYYSKQFWNSYLDILAASRFNRFNLAFGFGYDFPRGVTDDYFHFPYPYLVNVPGYDVRVVPLADGERERNLAMLQFIASETARRGLQFQLGIWTHAYAWTDSPNSTHQITGLSPETHARYCRDALAMLLKACPEIRGVTMRVHGESGIPEGNYPFWQTLFEAVTHAGRQVEIDMHAKGINQIMIDMACATNQPVKVSPKYWAEHQGLGYHQADIRAQEIPKPDQKVDPTFAVSNGARSFTRYGYADLFQQDRKFDVLFRLWPGTQRHLLWGDPSAAAAYGRTSHFCGAVGIDICEPLTFKGREGSGLPGGRCAYGDASLDQKDEGWRKFEYTYRLWGRLLYNPDATPLTWRRYLQKDFGLATESTDTAVANASRVLPLITTAHLPSASNHSFWPELYENMPIVLGHLPSPYSDTPTPKCFGTVSPLDPQLFSRIIDHAANILSGSQDARYSPVEVAQWLDEFAANAETSLTTAKRIVGTKPSSEFRRMEEDVLIQIGLGRFFSQKIRSALLYEIYLQTGDPKACQFALDQYRKARASWSAMAERAKFIYRPDISYGSIPSRRGHWLDRLPKIDQDIAFMQQLSASKPQTQSATKAIQAVMTKYNRPSVNCIHTPATTFKPGQPLPITLTASESAITVKLRYRHVNHAERWESTVMEKMGQSFHAVIPANYTNSPYPLQYYLELSKVGAAWLYPAFNSTLSNQPYYSIWSRKT